MNNFIKQVLEFHQKFKHPCPESINLGDSKLQELRLSLIREETQELEDALQANDPVAVLDAIDDLLVVVCGAGIAFGLTNKIEDGFNEVMRANFSKLDSLGNPIFRSDGKILKSELYIKPNLHQFFEDRLIQ